MSFYSDSNVRTHYIDPKTYLQGTHLNNGGRVNFELDGNQLAYLPNMRLLNVGVSSNGAHIYNRLLGGYSLIRNIRLMDGNAELCALNEQQLYRGFLNLNNPNAKNETVKSVLARNSLGSTIQGATRTINRIQVVAGATAVEATTASSWLDLRELFPMLNSVSHLPTAVFKNLNIQIEYQSSLDRQILIDVTAHLSSLRPILAVDVMTNPNIVNKLNKGLTSARWLEVEHDRFIIPQSANDGAAGDQNLVQEVNVKINGFNAKHIERVLIVKEIANASKELNGNAVRGYGRYSSQACFKQVVQARVNGRNVFPRNGISGNNERSAYLIDAWGDFTAFPGFNQYGFASAAIQVNGADFRGQSDYIGMYIGEYINDLQINYSRTGLQQGGGAGAKRATTDQLNAHVYAEVAKQIIIRPNGTYNIEYAQN